MCQDAERRGLHCSPTADAVGPVVRELSQRLDSAAAGRLDTQVSALQLVRRDDLYVCYILVAALLDRKLDMKFEVTGIHCPQALHGEWVSNVQDDLTLCLRRWCFDTACIVCTC